MSAVLFSRMEESDALERPLRPHQARAIDLLRASFASGHKRPMLQAPCAFGKTRCAAEIINSAMTKNRCVAFCVPRLSLIDQTLQSFYDDGVLEMGVIQANHAATDWDKPVQVCSLQTLEKRPYFEADLIMIDEAHLHRDFIGQWMKDRPTKPFIGLSATPWARGLGNYYDDLLIAATMRQLIDTGYHAPFTWYGPSHPDLKGVKTQAGDYHEGQLSERMNTEGLVADIVTTWINLGENRPTLCFAVDCAHAKHIQERFTAAGIPCGYQDAYTDDAERARIRRASQSGEYKIVANVLTLSTGVDWPWLSCIIFARPTKSEMLFVQAISRGGRIHPPLKHNCIVLDHTDTALTVLGFVENIHHDKLSTAQKGDKEPKPAKPTLPKECPKCHALRAPKVNKCPVCGFTAEKKNKIESADGELVELAGKKKSIPAGMVQLGRVLIGENAFYRQLKWLAIERGWKSGWIEMKFREKQKHWAPFAWRDDAAMEPTPDVRSWVTAGQIRYAKGKQKREAANAPA